MVMNGELFWHLVVIFQGLDENNSAVIIEATVNCLAELVDNQIEEIGLDTQFFSSVFPGYVQPSLQVRAKTELDVHGNKFLKKLNDTKTWAHDHFQIRIPVHNHFEAPFCTFIANTTP